MLSAIVFIAGAMFAWYVADPPAWVDRIVFNVSQRLKGILKR